MKYLPVLLVVFCFGCNHKPPTVGAGFKLVSEGLVSSVDTSHLNPGYLQSGYISGPGSVTAVWTSTGVDSLQILHKQINSLKSLLKKERSKPKVTNTNISNAQTVNIGGK